ncbi:MAG TPA: ATP-binding protein [Thermoanaerobaculia bacterium]|nr:ATP-binding protein [Thermoanaerobaculia bacterium]
MTESPDFRLLFESAPGAYLVLDTDFRIVAATSAWLAATGIFRESITGRNIFDVLPDGSADSVRASLEIVLRTREAHAMPARAYAPRGSDSENSQLSAGYRPLVNKPVLAGSEVAYIIHAIEDVTDLVRLEQLRSENAQTTSQLSSLQEADREKDEFIAIISHELRTPMTSILGWTRMLALGGLDEETRREALDSLERSTLAQAKLIEDLLDESRIAAGKLRFEPRALDLRAVVKTAVSMVRPSADVKRITLSADYGAERCEAFGDPSRLQQAVGNLLGNAIKFTPEDGTVAVRLGCEQGKGIIEVRDNGSGVDPELLPFIFERFRQGDGHVAERRSGLGLGLSITRHLVEMHGGSVIASSEGEGRGSIFTIRLPLHESVEAAHDFVGRDTGARLGALPRLDGVRVLIVEDEIDNRNVLTAVLRHCGAEVTCAGTAATACELAAEWRADVIICDISLPDFDGCALLPQLRSRENVSDGLTPALALTVLGRPGEQARITAAGFDVFRQKPIDPVDLAHEVRRLAYRRTAGSGMLPNK